MRPLLRSLPLLLAALPSLAQTTAALRLKVLDAEGRPAVRATVVLTAVDRGEQRRLVTDARGEAFAAGLLPGSYRIQGQVIRLRADERAELTVRSGEAAATVVVEDS
ncbi:MAG TPA: carboxypeptidase-like regulatory domain-containing protein, partial [Holophaga sp.]|nr:carboxypeptidase-like regulatory domain-containing protein [Holophaga sp.]